jgi:hypothetical protein
VSLPSSWAKSASRWKPEINLAYLLTITKAFDTALINISLDRTLEGVAETMTFVRTKLEDGQNNFNMS